MRLSAYILAADPAWIEASVLSYYDFVQEIIVSYDQNSKGWTGAPVPVEECLSRLRAIDHDQKMRFCPGDYGHFHDAPMNGETYQRQCSIAATSGADWVLQIDTDEILPKPSRLVEMLEYAERQDIPAVEWPMRVFFQRLGDGRFLEVCQSEADGHYEYPGPIAVRPGVKLIGARRTDGKFVRGVVAGDRYSLQVKRPPEPNEHRFEGCRDEDAILHFSWVRTPGEIRSKIASWGHNEGFKSVLFYHIYWKNAPRLWRWLRNFHPFAHDLWPRLKATRLSMKGVNL